MNTEHAGVKDVCYLVAQSNAERIRRSRRAFPLTLAISLRERESRAPRWEQSRRFGSTSSGERFSLSPGERAGVRAGVASVKIEECSVKIEERSPAIGFGSREGTLFWREGTLMEP